MNCSIPNDYWTKTISNLLLGPWHWIIDIINKTSLTEKQNIPVWGQENHQYVFVYILNIYVVLNGLQVDVDRGIVMQAQGEQQNIGINILEMYFFLALDEITK